MAGKVSRGEFELVEGGDMAGGSDPLRNGHSQWASAMAAAAKAMDRASFILWLWKEIALVLALCGKYRPPYELPPQRQPAPRRHSYMSESD